MERGFSERPEKALVYRDAEVSLGGVFGTLDQTGPLIWPDARHHANLRAILEANVDDMVYVLQDPWVGGVLSLVSCDGFGAMHRAHRFDSLGSRNGEARRSRGFLVEGSAIDFPRPGHPVEHGVIVSRHR